MLNATSIRIGTFVLHKWELRAKRSISPLALLGLPVLKALGRLTFMRDGSLTVTPSSAALSSDTGAPLWLGDSQLLVEAGTLGGTQGFHFGGTHEPRLLVLDTGSGSSYLTDHYFKEHPEQFPEPPPETAKLAGAGGELDFPAYMAHQLPLWFGSSRVELAGQHVLSIVTSYTIDLRLMRFTVQP
jgi:hypothetical protein